VERLAAAGNRDNDNNSPKDGQLRNRNCKLAAAFFRAKRNEPLKFSADLHPA
jgi:hypothetical protein